MTHHISFPNNNEVIHALKYVNITILKSHFEHQPPEVTSGTNISQRLGRETIGHSKSPWASFPAQTPNFNRVSHRPNSTKNPRAKSGLKSASWGTEHVRETCRMERVEHLCYRIVRSWESSRTGGIGKLRQRVK